MKDLIQQSFRYPQSEDVYPARAFAEISSGWLSSRRDRRGSPILEERGYLNDEEFVKIYIEERRNLRPREGYKL